MRYDHSGTHASNTGPPPRFTWSRPTGLAALSLINALLGFVTLGIYHFWGRTEVRKRIWSAIRIDGEPLAYTGTGREMLIGFLVVFAAVLVPSLLISVLVASALGPPGAGLSQPLFFVFFTFLYGVGVYRAYRYRFSRTRWRGIRGTLVGNSAGYGWTYLWTAALIPVTLGWIYPWRATRLQRLLVDDMRFGDKAFTFEEDPGPLYGRFIVLWLGGLAGLVAFGGGMTAIVATNMTKAKFKAPTQLDPHGIALFIALIAIIYMVVLVASSWYRAGQFNHFAASTSYDGVPLKGSMTGTGLFMLTLTNLAIVVFSLGVLQPLAQARSARYFLQSLALTGPIALEQIAQSTAAADTRGEGLAQAFDFDAF